MLDFHRKSPRMTALNPARWAALSPQIDELLTLPPLQRAQRLDEIAANDPRTAGELRELLAAGADASRVGFMGGVADAGLAPSTPASAAHAAQAGAVLGPWTLVEAIGEGGMGTVWRARRSDGRYEGVAAIKLLKSGLFDSAAQERFRREGGILARLRHPGIAQLLDAGVSPQGQSYLVLELVQGLRIDRWCEAQGLSVRQRIELFVQVLDAVQAAHAQLTIHRDLKPSNILVDDSGRVKLLDFGIARLLPEAQAEQTALTREGSFALTPEYAAPEQFEGGVLSVATDVYALGVVLYELLAATHPSGLAVGAAPLQYMQAALQTPARRASLVAPLAVRLALRGDIDNILAKALRVPPAERYAGVADLADDLRRHLADEPVSARRLPLWLRTFKWVRRHKVPAAAAAAVVVAIAAGVAGTAAQARRAEAEAGLARQERSRAVLAATESDLQRSRALLQSELAAQASRQAEASATSARAAAAVALREKQRADAQTMLASEAGARALAERDRALRALEDTEASGEFTAFLLTANGDKRFTADEFLARSATMIQRQFADEPEQRARLLGEVIKQLTELGQLERALAILVPARQAALATGSQALTVDMDCTEAAVKAHSGQFEAALRDLDAKLAVLRALPRPDKEVLMNCLSARSYLNSERGDAQAALNDSQELLALLGKPRPSQRAAAVRARSHLATALGRLGRRAEAVATFRALIAEMESLGRGDTSTTAILSQNMGVVLVTAGQTLAAIEAQQRALAILRSVQGDEAEVMNAVNLASMLGTAGRDEEALQMLQRSLNFARGQANPVRLGQVHLNLAIVHNNAGRLDACEASLLEAAKVLDTVLPPRHPGRVSIATARTRLAISRQQVDDAARLLDEAEAQQAPGSNVNASSMAFALMRSQIALLRSDVQGARMHVDRALPIAQRFSAGFASSQLLGAVFLQSARVHQRAGDVAAAVAEATLALSHLRSAVGLQAPASRSATALLAELQAR
jgi:serine/threonine-protein kinase